MPPFLSIFAFMRTGTIGGSKYKTVDEKETQVIEQEEDGEDEKDVVEDESTPQLLDGITLFDEVGDVINERSFKVMQVIGTDAARDGQRAYEIGPSQVSLLIPLE